MFQLLFQLLTSDHSSEAQNVFLGGPARFDALSQPVNCQSLLQNGRPQYTLLASYV